MSHLNPSSLLLSQYLLSTEDMNLFIYDSLYSYLQCMWNLLFWFVYFSVIRLKPVPFFLVFPNEVRLSRFLIILVKPIIIFKLVYIFLKEHFPGLVAALKQGREGTFHRSILQQSCKCTQSDVCFLCNNTAGSQGFTQLFKMLGTRNIKQDLVFCLYLDV